MLTNKVEWPMDANCFFQGRNGCFPCLGIEVMSGRVDGSIHLSPISRRGVANGFIEVPMNKLDELIEALIAVRPVQPGELV